MRKARNNGRARALAAARPKIEFCENPPRYVPERTEPNIAEDLMALVVVPEEFCVFRANQAKLSNGHNEKRCPQCQAIRRVVIQVNNATLDRIAEVFKRCEPGTVIAAEKIAEKIEALKTVQ